MNRSSPITRKTPLQPGKPLHRKAAPRRRKPKQKQPKRDWTEARAKVEREGRCRLHRLGGCGGKREAAHIVGREHDRTLTIAEAAEEVHTASDILQPGAVWLVHPHRTVPLCRAHHRRYDPHTRGTAGSVDLLPVLSLDEQLQAVKDAGSIVSALRRTTGARYVPENEAV